MFCKSGELCPNIFKSLGSMYVGLLADVEILDLLGLNFLISELD